MGIAHGIWVQHPQNTAHGLLACLEKIFRTLGQIPILGNDGRASLKLSVLGYVVTCTEFSLAEFYIPLSKSTGRKQLQNTELRVLETFPLSFPPCLSSRRN